MTVKNKRVNSFEVLAVVAAIICAVLVAIGAAFPAKAMEGAGCPAATVEKEITFSQQPFVTESGEIHFWDDGMLYVLPVNYFPANVWEGEVRPMLLVDAAAHLEKNPGERLTFYHSVKYEQDGGCWPIGHSYSVESL